MADAIAENALIRGRLHYREAWLYFENRYVGMTYMLNATEHAKEGNDIADFVRSFRDACEAPACNLIRLRDIQRGALLTLGDPMLYYALYGFASAYIAEGKISSAMPMLPVGHGVRVLPSIGFQLAPYGTERLFRTALIESRTGAAAAARFTTATLRVGNSGSSTPWGVDVRAPSVRVFRSVRAGVTVSVWRQPPLLADDTSEPLKTGAAATATVTVPLGKFTRTEWLRAKVTAGYKSEGFVPGEQLSGGIVIRAGLTVLR